MKRILSCLHYSSRFFLSLSLYDIIFLFFHLCFCHLDDFHFVFECLKESYVSTIFLSRSINLLLKHSFSSNLPSIYLPPFSPHEFENIYFLAVHTLSLPHSPRFSNIFLSLRRSLSLFQTLILPFHLSLSSFIPFLLYTISFYLPTHLHVSPSPSLPYRVTSSLRA